jgi:hypothetical protein
MFAGVTDECVTHCGKIDCLLLDVRDVANIGGAAEVAAAIRYDVTRRIARVQLGNPLHPR